MKFFRFIYQIRWLFLEIAGVILFAISVLALFMLGRAFAQGGINRVIELTDHIRTYPVLLASAISIIYIGYIGYTMFSHGHERRKET